MRQLISSVLLLTAVALIPADLAAQRRPAARSAAARADKRPSFGVQLDYGSDTDFGIGGRGVFTLRAIAPRTPLDGIVSFDYYFPDGFDFWEINGNVVYRFRVQRTTLGPYAGGGLNIGHASVDVPGPGGGSVSDTKAGLNLLAGTTFKARKVTPFAEFRGVIGDELVSQVVLTGGVRF